MHKPTTEFVTADGTAHFQHKQGNFRKTSQIFVNLSLSVLVLALYLILEMEDSDEIRHLSSHSESDQGQTRGKRYFKLL